MKIAYFDLSHQIQMVLPKPANLAIAALVGCALGALIMLALDISSTKMGAAVLASATFGTVSSECELKPLRNIKETGLFLVLSIVFYEILISILS